jgi:hypothetical protein
LSFFLSFYVILCDFLGLFCVFFVFFVSFSCFRLLRLGPHETFMVAFDRDMKSLDGVGCSRLCPLVSRRC